MKNLYRQINERTGGAVEIARQTLSRFGRERAPEAAASMAFFGFFSLFPLLLLLVSTGSSILHRPGAQDQILGVLMEAFPFSIEIVEENIQKVLKARGSVQLISLAGLAWSATGAFTILTRNINRAWPDADRHNFVKMRFMALLMVVGMVAVMVVLLLANTLTRFLPQSVNSITALILSLRYFSRVMISIMTFITLVWIYRWIPNTEVLWAESAWGALVASLGMVLATSGFTWYLSSGRGISNYNLVYGSLGTIVALMFWVYLLSIIVLFGAHLTSSIAYYRRLQ